MREEDGEVGILEGREDADGMYCMRCMREGKQLFKMKKK